MKRLFIPVILALFVLLPSACGDQPLLGPDDSAIEGIDAHRFGFGGRCGAATFMTRNMYVGADVDAIIDALMSESPDDDFPAILTAVQTLRLTHFPARAAAMADEIARGKPDIVGLQEVSKIDIILPPIPGVLDDGFELHLDFLPTLLAELSDRHLDYEVEIIQTNIEAVPPIEDALVSLVDHDAILVNRKRVDVNGVFGKLFDVNIGPVAEGVSITRGWVMVDASVCNVSYKVVNTHLESGHDVPDLTQIRAGQALEIVTALGAASPAVVLGDLNDWPGTPMYQILEGAGFTDVWVTLRPWSKGYTCCHKPALYNVFAQFDERIDYVWMRGFGHTRGLIYRTGWLPFERVPGLEYKIWPSDHAGVVAKLKRATVPALVAP